MPGRAAAWHPPILQGNEQSRKIRTGWRRACTTDSLFLFFYSAKPISEMQRLYPFPSSSLSRERNRAWLCSLPVRLQAEQKNENRVEACLHDRQPVFIFLFGEADKRDAATLSLPLFFSLQGAESSLALLFARPSPGRAEK